MKITIEKRKTSFVFICLCVTLCFNSCQSEFLDAKPSTDIVQPSSLQDLYRLLDNERIINMTPALPQASADEYFIHNEAVLNALFSATQRNAYTWEIDLFGGEVDIADWNQPYQAIFYANSVLDALELMHERESTDGQRIRGWALFIRAYAMYSLVSNFAPLYDESTSSEDLGIPIQLKSSIDELVQRATVADTYQQIFSDLNEAEPLIWTDIPTMNRNRPSQVAVHALRARIYLSMRQYESAEYYADKCWSMYSDLIDYNTIDTVTVTPFTYNSAEIIYHTRQVNVYSTTTGYGDIMAGYIGVDTSLIDLYSTDDLRLPIFFETGNNGYQTVKRGYVGGGSYPFTGLSTGEVLLVKAECAARRGDVDVAQECLNELLVNRYVSGSFAPFVLPNQQDALKMVLYERRKELVWRGLRWSDIKRLNKEGAAITIERRLEGQTFSLPPNSPKYIFPIPDDEIALSGIAQNDRF
ncbi:RagB/SusD family nutrient uptake outer membrane protein [Olivibacter sp. SDN3]|uniref:RagB/SusD family nutrient uptake outer membrane protein n=1 Tax=Olivibacter sp. SDN3 TaxID=2764720 RepID=UPI001650FC6A|nr:RagB/SusD family nutrient uptake outer membrane protein [Olivibacter sp. SDN3]QNL48145.1 RagB/SusD family nutrient uptake outer membrane protein [Olivibacter sp. SDN3]